MTYLIIFLIAAFICGLVGLSACMLSSKISQMEEYKDFYDEQ